MPKSVAPPDSLPLSLELFGNLNPIPEATPPRKTASPAAKRRSPPRALGIDELAAALRLSRDGVTKLQVRFHLPVFAGKRYAPAYLEFLRTVVQLLALNVKENALTDLWDLELKLLNLMQAGLGNASPTWFLDQCGARRNRRRRLLLSQFDIGVELPPLAIQPGLALNDSPPELFDGRDMGEDELTILELYLNRLESIHHIVDREWPRAAAAAKWGRQFCRYFENARPAAARKTGKRKNGPRRSG
ncbi:MAG: hypothetical protein H7A52_08480 [Akkermansiaceae bacterium]|nr:hypothetical protein [Akkermansiaceae bacterium]